MLFWKDVGNGILLDRPLPFKLHQSYRPLPCFIPAVGSREKKVRWWRWWPQHRGRISLPRWSGNAVIVTALADWTNLMPQAHYYTSRGKGSWAEMKIALREQTHKSCCFFTLCRRHTNQMFWEQGTKSTSMLFSIWFHQSQQLRQGETTIAYIVHISIWDISWSIFCHILMVFKLYKIFAWLSPIMLFCCFNVVTDLYCMGKKS